LNQGPPLFPAREYSPPLRSAKPRRLACGSAYREGRTGRRACGTFCSLRVSFEQPIDVAAHPTVAREVGFDVRAGPRSAHAQLLRQPKGRDSVHEPKFNALARSRVLFVHRLGECRILPRRSGYECLVLGKGSHQERVFREMRHHRVRFESNRR